MKGQILLVDDERPVREMVAEVLATMGHGCVAVRDGTAALAQLAARRFAAQMSAGLGADTVIQFGPRPRRRRPGCSATSVRPASCSAKTASLHHLPAPRGTPIDSVPVGATPPR